MSIRQKKRFRFGVGLNVCGAVGLLTIGTVKHLSFAVILGVVEALFSALVLWTYRRTPVRPDAN
jgi:hypothetical protein